jgi:YidC/Oxa1 family membrane protein insertase
MESKNLILAVALSAAVFFAYSLFAPRPAPRPAGEAPADVAPAPAAQAAAPAPTASAAQVPAAPARKAFLENDRIRLELLSTGGAVVRAELKDYRDKPGKGGAPFEVLGGATGFDLAGDVRLTGGALGFGSSFLEVEQKAGRVVYAWDSPAGLRVEKTYSLAPGRYDVDLTVVVRNRGAGPLREQLGL